MTNLASAIVRGCPDVLERHCYLWGSQLLPPSMPWAPWTLGLSSLVPAQALSGTPRSHSRIAMSTAVENPVSRRRLLDWHITPLVLARLPGCRRSEILFQASSTAVVPHCARLGRGVQRPKLRGCRKGFRMNDYLGINGPSRRCRCRCRWREAGLWTLKLWEPGNPSRSMIRAEWPRCRHCSPGTGQGSRPSITPTRQLRLGPQMLNSSCGHLVGCTLKLYLSLCIVDRKAAT